jgi:hypothetical protein
MSAVLDITAKDNASETIFRLEQANLRLIEQMKRFAQESKRAHQESKDGFARTNQYIQAQIGDLKSLALGFIGGGGIIGAVQMAVSAYGDWKQSMIELGEKHHEVSRKILEDLTKVRHAEDMPKIETLLGKTAGATRGEAEQMYRGVQGVLPDATLGTTEEVLNAGNAMLPFLHGREEQWGKLKATAKKLNPQLQGEQVGGVAAQFMTLAGNHLDEVLSDKFTKATLTLERAGMTPEQAEGMMFAGMKVGQGRPAAAMALAEALDKKMEVIQHKHGHRLTDEEQAKNRFAVADQPEKLRLLQSDKEVQRAVLGEQASQVGLMVDEQGKSRPTEALLQAKTAGFTEARAEALGALSSGGQEEGIHKATLEMLKAGKERRRQAAFLEAYNKQYATMGEQLGPSERFEASMMNWPGLEDRPDRDFAKMYRWKERNVETRDPAASKRYAAIATGWEKFAAGQDVVRQNDARDDRAEELRRQNTIQEEQLRALREIQSNTRPKASSAAVQANVRQHGEPQ